MARLSFALPSLARCERPRAASVRACRLQPGRLAQGPDEKCGTAGRTPGIVFVMSLPFQIGAPRWGGVSRRRDYGRARPASRAGKCGGGEWRVANGEWRIGEKIRPLRPSARFLRAIRYSPFAI